MHTVGHFYDQQVKDRPIKKTNNVWRSRTEGQEQTLKNDQQYATKETYKRDQKQTDDIVEVSQI